MTHWHHDARFHWFLHFFVGALTARYDETGGIRKGGDRFVLVGKDGKVKWIKDYGAPQNGGFMYVPVEELYREIERHLTSP